MIFECGGGDVPSDKSLSMSSHVLGQTETFILPKAPLAMCMGKIVEGGKPYIWIPGSLPFHVTDLSKLKIICPLKFRLYANRVEENVPIFREKVKFGKVVPANTATTFINAKALPASSDATGHGPSDAVEDAEYLLPPVDNEDLDVPITIPDVVTCDTPEDILADKSIRVRSMSRRELIVEAASIQHKRDHYPHNPYCEICVCAHMRQHSYNRKKDKSDDELPAITAPRERLSADHMIAQRAIDGVLEHSVSFTIRDEWSGAGIAGARRQRTMEQNRLDLKNFVGKVSSTRPNIMVKSDAAKEITSAVSDLGWLSEPSLQNRFPHNSSHERWIGTLKSSIRAAVLQSGFPDKIVDWSVPYSALSLTLKQPCPIHKHERDASGITLPAFKHKEEWTCWQAHHNGEPFSGKRPVYGQLVYFLDDKSHILMPRTSAGLFVGWRMESGLRYRGVLLIADYEIMRQGVYRWNQIKHIHEKEVHVPDEPVFPFAEARKQAIESMKTPASLLMSLSELPLPYSEENGDEVPSELKSPAITLPDKIPKFRINTQRLIKFGPTLGCDGCLFCGYRPLQTSLKGMQGKVR